MQEDGKIESVGETENVGVDKGIKGQRIEEQGRGRRQTSALFLEPEASQPQIYT